MSRRDERIELQKRDNGDPDDTVYVAIGHSRNHSCNTYHEDTDCIRLQNKDDEDLRPKTRSYILRSTKAPCKSCVLNGSENA